MNVKSVYGEMNLAADLNISKDLLVWVPEPDGIHGDFLYLADVRLKMRGQTTSLYKEELQNLIEYCLKRRADGIHYANYNVLGEFPIQLLYFLVHNPRDMETARWRYKDEITEMMISTTRIEHLDDYLKHNYCH